MAAGLGFKDFTTGEVLTAADVDGYLMQGIWVFASTAARDAAVTAPAEGNFAFTKDTNSLWYYDGAAWVASGAAGDIEGVTAGVGISGGGTSGTVTVTNSMATAITTAGDTLYGTGSGTFSRLGIGTAGQVLKVNSGATAPEWGAAGGSSGLTLIQRSSFSNVAGTSTTFDGVFSSTYASYIVQIEKVGSATAADDMRFSLRTSGSDATNHYGQLMYNSYNTNTWSNTSGSGLTYITISNNQDVTYPLGMQLAVTNVGSSNTTLISGIGFGLNINDINLVGGGNATAHAATGFRLASASTNITGTVAVYGLAK